MGLLSLVDKDKKVTKAKATTPAKVSAVTPKS
jgi:hypothetical protein